MLRKTTQLSDLFGIKSTGRLASTNANNDITITASTNGIGFNDVTVEYVSGGTVAASYNRGTKTLTVTIEDGESTANEVIAAINAEGTFSARLDGRDTTSGNLAGTGNVNIQNFGIVTDGGSGEPLDTASGLILTNGGESGHARHQRCRNGRRPVQSDLQRRLGSGRGDQRQAEPASTSARMLSGADFTIGENGGTTATQLGIRTYTGCDPAGRFQPRRRRGEQRHGTTPARRRSQRPTSSITARDGTALTVDLDSATSLRGCGRSRSTAQPGNHVGTTAVTASLTPDGRGIELEDSSTPITGDSPCKATQRRKPSASSRPASASMSDNTVNGSGNYSLNSYRHTLDDDFVIVARDGTELWIDLTGADDGSGRDRPGEQPRRNNNGTTPIQARLAATGNGIELVDSSTVTTGDLTVRAAEGSQAAQLLGFIPTGETEASSTRGRAAPIRSPAKTAHVRSR